MAQLITYHVHVGPCGTLEKGNSCLPAKFHSPGLSPALQTRAVELGAASKRLACARLHCAIIRGCLRVAYVSTTCA